ncbi:hypothetical protein THOG05_190043 [Vibrio rotiferianus]|nr:hypothetical protein THOG05_190043 [Vibrio rotiferianus]
MGTYYTYAKEHFLDKIYPVTCNFIGNRYECCKAMADVERNEQLGIIYKEIIGK